MRLTTKQKVAIASLVSRGLRALRALVGRGAEVDAVRRGIRWSLDLREGIDLGIYLGIYENETAAAIKRELLPGWVVLDIGANIGAHTLPMAKEVGPNGRVIAFEPTRYALAKLRRNLSLNPELERRVTCCQTLLVAETAKETVQAIHSSWPLVDTEDVHPLHRGRLMSVEGSSSLTLDDCVWDLGLSRVDLIKLDVDGNELSVLAGGRRTLTQFRPVLDMEFAPYVHDEDGREGFDALLALLRAVRYTAESERDGRPVALTREGIAVHCADCGGVNLILRPAG